eukprot:CAMPEP_0117823762 /NCGR_PEP_ID=MMETSP0949-20121206/4471_1 /TAXON_ID=44440 /ORGANISM="Chattonella subsalsa, Strain CCMP2191" /LENGTH=421 /DNA_ID=CAMNT_0005663399 /DNA_START=31 /DNA_END=1297 /DNA_ORIENTATION=-
MGPTTNDEPKSKSYRCNVEVFPSKILIFRERTVVGRSRKHADIVINLMPLDPEQAKEIKPTISRKHAEILVDESGKVCVRDLGSTNGIFHNDIKVSKAFLEDNDHIQFGGASGVPNGTHFSGSAPAACYCFEKMERPIQYSNKKRKALHQLDANEYQSQNSSCRFCNSNKNSNVLDQAKNSKMEHDSSNVLKETENLMLERDLIGLHSRHQQVLREKKECEMKFKEAVAELEKLKQSSDMSNTFNANDIYESFQKELICPLCKDILLDAVVIPCSHAFCFLCWHDHSENQITNLNKKVGCPVCTKRYEVGSIQSHRSMHLDNLASLISKQFDEEASSRWAKRVELSEKRITELQLQDQIVAEQGDPTNQSQSQIMEESFSEMVDVSNLCEGCNEGGHDFENCPHRSESACESSDDEEDSEG